jgi:hypothetical protein
MTACTARAHRQHLRGASSRRRDFRRFGASAALTQATNDGQQVVPMGTQLQASPQDPGRVKQLTADTGYASADNVNACAKTKIQRLIAIGCEAHHGGPCERFADAAAR